MNQLPRLVALLSIPAKIFEFILYERIYNKTKNQINNSQHGFLLEIGVHTNLASFTQYLLDQLDDQVDTIFTDFSKVLNKVHRSVLVIKMRNVGFSDHSLRFFDTYFRERMQFVEYKNVESQHFHCTQRVSRGSNLFSLFNIPKYKFFFFLLYMKCTYYKMFKYFSAGKAIKNCSKDWKSHHCRKGKAHDSIITASF